MRQLEEGGGGGALCTFSPGNPKLRSAAVE